VSAFFFVSSHQHQFRSVWVVSDRMQRSALHFDADIFGSSRALVVRRRVKDRTRCRATDASTMLLITVFDVSESKVSGDSRRTWSNATKRILSFRKRYETIDSYVPCVGSIKSGSENYQERVPSVPTPHPVCARTKRTR
jgi:hypothetical protein